MVLRSRHRRPPSPGAHPFQSLCFRPSNEPFFVKTGLGRAFKLSIFAQRVSWHLQYMSSWPIPRDSPAPVYEDGSLTSASLGTTCAYLFTPLACCGLVYIHFVRWFFPVIRRRFSWQAGSGEGLLGRISLRRDMLFAQLLSIFLNNHPRLPVQLSSVLR